MAHRLPLADIKFIADFAAFCRTKGDEPYDAMDAQACALAQFGYPGINACLPEEKAEMAARGVPSLALKASLDGWRDDWRFSALADRLDALILDAPRVS